MNKTMTEKIYSRHSRTGHGRAGEISSISPDVILINDTSGSITFDQFALMGAETVSNPSSVVLVTDHFSPAKDISTAESNQRLRDFARRHALAHYDSIRYGIEHAMLPEIGRVGPGALIFGSDSHTCTAGAYNASGMGFGSTDLAAVLATGEIWVRIPPSIRIDLYGQPPEFVTGKDIILSIIAELGTDGATNMAVEFGGPGMHFLDLDERVAIANMTVEAGAETCVFECDDQVLERIRSGGWTNATPVSPDENAEYVERHVIHLDTLESLVAKPPSPANGVSVTSLHDVQVHQVYIGNCANGTITDLRQAASVLKGRKVHPDVRMIVVPSTNLVYRQAAKEGLLEIFAAAGAAISLPTCGACFGGNMGILGDGEIAIATTNRNFRGRMGHPNSNVYLANAWIAAATAVKGKISSPIDL